jgi:hypothetical protein
MPKTSDKIDKPKTWAEKQSVINNPVTRTLIARPAKSVASVLAFFAKKMLSVPAAVAGNGPATFNGSTEIFEEQSHKMQEVLHKLREFNTTSGMSDEDKKRFIDRIDQAEAMRVTRLKIAEDILKKDEEEKKIAEEKLKKQVASLRGNADDVEKENANAILTRILTSLVGLDVLDVLDIAVSILKNFVDTNFASGVQSLVADETITGPFAKAAHALRIDEFAGLLAKFPLIGDVNEGFTQFANSDYVSPFSSILGQTAQSEAANLIFRTLFVANAVGQEVDLNNRYKEAHDNIDSAIPKMTEFARDSINDHIQKTAPTIIELETRDELKYLSFKAFLEDKDKVPLNKIFPDEFLNRKMRDADGKDSPTSIRDYLENLRNPHLGVSTQKNMKDFAQNPQNREIIEIILNTVDQKYSLNQGCEEGKKEVLQKIIQKVKPGFLETQFLEGGFKESFAPQVHRGIMEGLNNGKNLSDAIMGLEKTQIDNAIVAIAKIVKHDEMVMKIKTTTPKQKWADKITEKAADSVTQVEHAPARVR